MAKRSQKPPSRVKYEESHPTVSCRVPRETYERLQAIKEKQGKSFADILRIGMGILKAKAKKEGEVREEAYSEGYDDGYREAKQEFKVTYPCSVCGKTITLNSEGEKEAASGYMEEYGWGHAECHKKRQQGYL